MPMHPCPDCRTEISDAAKACPKCGRPVKKNLFARILFIGAGVFIVLAVIGSLLPDPEGEPVAGVTNTASQPVAATSRSTGAESKSTEPRARVVSSIPGKYALIEVVGDFSKSSRSDLEALLRPLKAQHASGIKDVHVAFYQRGTRYGDVPYSIVETRDGGATIEVYMATDFTEDKRKRLNDVLAYTARIKVVGDEYRRNEVVAYDTYNGRDILFRGKVTDISSALGRPHIVLDGDSFGMGGLTVVLDKDDQFVRTITKGSRVIVRANIYSFMMDQMQARGKIVSVD